MSGEPRNTVQALTWLALALIIPVALIIYNEVAA